MSIETIISDDVDIEPVFGSAIERRENPELITGEATYTDDIQHPKIAHIAVLRSQHGHANGIDTSVAEAMNGVLAAYTAQEEGS